MSAAKRPIKKTPVKTAITRQSQKTRAATQAMMASFVQVQLDSGLLCCRIMKQMSRCKNRYRAFQRAQAAYDVAQDWIWKLRIPHSELTR